MPRIVALSGSLSQPSRTRALTELIATRAAAGTSAQIDVIDIADLAPHLGGAVSFTQLPPAIVHAQRTLEAADLIVLASPVYKGSYSGLFKHFIDLLDPTRLAGKVALLAATGGSDRHALVVEHQLRPLASFFELVTVPAGVFVKDAAFTHYQLDESSPDARAALARIELALAQARRLLNWPAQAPAASPISLAA